MTKMPDVEKLILFKKLYTKQMGCRNHTDNMSSGLAIFVAAIDEQNEFYSQQQLSEFLGCNKAHTSRTLAKLQEKGLVEPISSRNSVIKLTEKGKKLAETTKSIKHDFCVSLVKGVTDEEMKTFEKVLDKILNNAKILTKKESV